MAAKDWPSARARSRVSVDGKLQTPASPAQRGVISAFPRHVSPSSSSRAFRGDLPAPVVAGSAGCTRRPRELAHEPGSLAGEAKPASRPLAGALSAEHYGLLVFLLSQTFDDEEQAIAALPRRHLSFRVQSARMRY